MRDINGEFPSESHPYTEDYDYLSDSDLEDGSSHSEEESAGAPENDGRKLHSTTSLNHPSQPSAGTSETQNYDRLAPTSLRPPNISR